ncbi:MAG: hypothetical protein LBT57_01705 [Puniceicoccales bacterium]|jgi:hypothetical protein|nr:hypothetical protein [Puniceicoccales bacterium]
MRTKRSRRKIADLLAEHSWDPLQAEKLSAERVEAVLSVIGEYPLVEASRLRHLYGHALEAFFRRRCVEIEYCGPYTAPFFERLRDRFQERVGLPLSYVARENPQLLSGLRVRYGDHIWSRNVRDNLDAFRRAIPLRGSEFHPEMQ